MSWNDTFYPGNPGRRRRIAQLLTKLLTLMEGNTYRTNSLIDVLHTHLHWKEFSKISFDYNKSVKDNCDVVVNTLTEIETCLSDKKTTLKDLLEPDIFKQIFDTNVRFVEKLELGRKLSGAALASTGTVPGIVVCTAAVSEDFSVGLDWALGMVAACGVAGIVTGELDEQTDAAIISFVDSAMEKPKLDESINELKKVLTKFENASYEYSIKVEKIITLAEIACE